MNTRDNLDYEIRVSEGKYHSVLPIDNVVPLTFFEK